MHLVILIVAIGKCNVDLRLEEFVLDVIHNNGAEDMLATENMWSINHLRHDGFPGARFAHVSSMVEDSLDVQYTYDLQDTKESDMSHLFPASP